MRKHSENSVGSVPAADSARQLSRNRRARRTALLLSGILLLGCVSGCGKGAGETASAPSGEAANTAAVEPASGESDLTAANDSVQPAAQETDKTQMQELSDNRELLPSVGGNRSTYEIFVYSFCDSDGDGIGDLNGIRSRLDYIEDMGFDQIWLTPVCPSSSYHKYSVTDYYSIDPQYGSLEDFSALLEDCHGRGIRVLTDMVLNHSSVQHPWFEAASAYLQSLGEDEAPSGEQCPEYTYYNFSGEKLTGYEPLEGTRFYYEARFSPRMPDLNLDNETVRNEIAEILRFWQELGVDGFRLDACTSYYTDDVARNVEFLSFVNETAKEARPDFYIVGEAWANQQVYAQYYGSGVDSFFDFAFAGAEGPIAKAARGKYSAEKLALELQKEQELYESFNQEYVNAPFYTNHDLNRSAGYYPGDDGSEAKLAGGLNLMMSGDAFVYYGEELGMKGSGRDENKRAPMYWSADPEAEGMTDGPPEMEEVSMKYPDAAHQVEDPDSIWQYYRCAVRIRRSFPALAGGRIRVNETLSDENCFAMVKELPETGEAILLLGNLSKEEISLNLAGEETAFRTLAAVLTVTRDPVVLEEETIRLPGMSMAVLVTEKKE